MNVGKDNTVVIGAGPIGAATARHLAEAGEKVILIGPPDPNGVADRAMPWSGWSDESRMNHSIDLPLPSAIMGHRSRSRYVDIQERSGISFETPHEALNVVAHPAGDPSVEASDSHYNMDAIRANAFDTSFQIVDVDESRLRELYPYLSFAPGTTGLLQPQGAILNPRRFVAAQLALLAKAGGEHIHDRATAVQEELTGVRVNTVRSGEVHADTVVVAAGAYINLDGLVPRPLDFEIIGLTVALARVPADTKCFPTLMYSDTISEAPFSGLIVPPVRYPDGNYYIKVTGSVALDTMSNNRHEVESWLHDGGNVEAAQTIRPVLEQLYPGLSIEKVGSRPCLVTANHMTTPYIGHVSDHVLVATEGDHGVTIADEAGRLAADFSRRGVWNDSLPEALFTPRFAAPLPARKQLERR